MDEIDTNSANIEAISLAGAGRRGRPAGLPKPPNSGRKKGVPNRATRDVRAAASKYTAKALKSLVDLLSSPDGKVRAIAAREILDRAHGRPMTPTELTGKDGAPLISGPEMSDFEVAQHLAFMLAKGRKEGNDEAKIRRAQFRLAHQNAHPRRQAAAMEYKPLV